MATETKTFKVKWGGKTKKIEFDLSEGFESFQVVLFSVFEVPPGNQKIFGKKNKLLRGDEDLLNLKNGARLKLIGTAEPGFVAPKKAYKFEEDMSEADRAKLRTAIPPGLGNLGNTCYLNATVQCLKSIPEFKQTLETFDRNSLDPSVPKALGKLFSQMSSTEESFAPYEFVLTFRQAFPRFAEQAPNGRGYLQQDADEFLTELFNSVGRENLMTQGNVIKNLFEGEFESEEKCLSTEEVESGIESFTKLTCFIDINISHLVFGLQKGLETIREKNSSVAGALVEWQKTMKISKLPKYLCIQMGRFAWKKIEGHDSGGVNCKLLRKVEFPQKLDVTSLCTKDLTSRIQAYRTAKLEWEDEQREKKQSEGLDLEAIRKEQQTGTKMGKKKENAEEAPAANDNAMEVEPAVNETTEETAMEVEKPSFEDSGEYELVGIVTHLGRSANSGHYIGYGKDQASGKWMKFDDEKVQEVPQEHIATLYGGGDFQMGYVLFYANKPTISFTEEESNTTMGEN